MKEVDENTPAKVEIGLKDDLPEMFEVIDEPTDQEPLIPPSPGFPVSFREFLGIDRND